MTIRAQALTPRDCLKAAPYLAMLPEIDVSGFWNRVKKQHHLPLLLHEGYHPFGLLIASVLETDSGRELRVSLATEPGAGRRHEDGLARLLDWLVTMNQCTVLSFESKRRGWERVARTLGFGEPETILRFKKEV